MKLYNKPGIYCIQNIINGKLYVGASKNIGQRFSKHKCDLKKGKHGNIYLQRAYNKYKIENFVFKAIIICEPFEMNKYEKLFIRLYDSSNKEKGYNLDSGGNIDICRSPETILKIKKALTGKKLSLEHRKKLSESHLGVNCGLDHYLCGKKMSDELRKKLSKSHMGNKHHFYGKHFSEEHKKNLSKSHTGKKMSAESKLKMSNARKGKSLSEETRKKLSISHKGLIRSETHCKNLSIAMTGKKASFETRQKIIIAQRQRREREKGMKLISETKE